jgi:hypothetical protein
MKLTIGMASYDNFEQVWFTIQALRTYHDLSDCEILVVDNFGHKEMEGWINYWCNNNTRYVKWNKVYGTAPAKGMVFEEARGDFVLCIDSHILLVPDSIRKLKEWIDKNPQSPHLYHGPMYYDDIGKPVDRQTPTHGEGLEGTWGEQREITEEEPFEILMQGTGVIGSFRKQWLGFHKDFYGFGGEEGYIHAKYRKHGRKVYCLPFLRWIHKFSNGNLPYPNITEDRVRNCILGHIELGLPVDHVKMQFSSFLVDKVLRENPELTKEN